MIERAGIKKLRFHAKDIVECLKKGAR